MKFHLNLLFSEKFTPKGKQIQFSNLKVRV